MLFTFSLDYIGGTYLAQIEAGSYLEAPEVWACQLDVTEITGIGAQGKKKLIQRMRDDTPVAVQGLTNVWCMTARIRGRLALIHYSVTVRRQQL